MQVVRVSRHDGDCFPDRACKFSKGSLLDNYLGKYLNLMVTQHKLTPAVPVPLLNSDNASFDKA